MLAAATTALLPDRWTRFADSLLQPFGWARWLVSSSARALRTAGETAATTEIPSLADYEQVVAELDEARRRIGHQSLMLQAVEEQLADVAGIRAQLGEARASIKIAAVAGMDPEPRREVLTILKGTRAGVTVGDWVASGQAGNEVDPRSTGRELLFEQYIIGRVIQVSAFEARVQLCSDPQFGPQRVLLARRGRGGALEPHARHAALVGRGDGVMKIDRSTADYLASDHTLVLVPLMHARPTLLAVGMISGVETLETRLHYDFEVVPLGEPRTLSYVYVISVGG